MGLVLYRQDMNRYQYEGHMGYTDKADPIREHDCIWCMACVSVCPPQAIKVDQSNLEFHEKASGTFNEVYPRAVHHHLTHINKQTFYLLFCNISI